MILEHVKVLPYNTTLMGVVKAVSDFYSLSHSAPTVYGASGHAFIINIHETLCPSGPYCFNGRPVFDLLVNLGIRTTDLGFFSTESDLGEREEVERVLREAIAAGRPCGLVNMEFQLVTGYDETGFITSQPWPHNDFPPEHLTFSTWDEFGEEWHANFFVFDKVVPANKKDMILSSLEHAIDLQDRPAVHTQPPYYTGLAAFDVWIEAVRNGHGNGHGNWWNATVWSECRAMAAEYMLEIDAEYPSSSQPLTVLTQDFNCIASLLDRVSDRDMSASKKVTLLEQAKEREAVATERIRELVLAPHNFR